MKNQNRSRRSRGKIRNTLPEHLHDLLQHCLVYEYESQPWSPTTFGSVVEDLGAVLPGVERWLEGRKFDGFRSPPRKFLVFCSPDPQTRSLCGGQRTLCQAVLSASAGSFHPWTNFKCRPVLRSERRAAVAKITALDLPYSGAQWVVEREQGAIAQYEQKYERLVAYYRYAQSRELSSREAGTSTVAAVGTSQPERAEDPITKKDQRNWVKYLLRGSTDVEEAEEVLLKDFMSEYGTNRTWTLDQWLTYLKNNKADIRLSIAKAQKNRIS